MKTTAFFCCLMMASGALCADAPQKKPAQTSAACTNEVSVVAAAEKPAVEKKTIKRAQRGRVRPRLGAMRRSFN